MKIILIAIFFEMLSSNPEFIDKMGCSGNDWVTIIKENGELMVVCGDPLGCQGNDCQPGKELPSQIKKNWKKGG